MFDIDDFKTINDKYGHDKGDLVLKKVTKKIKSTIRESDYFFRVGGEEFIILFPEYDVDNSFLFAEKIRQEVEDLEIINGEVITISIGLVQVEKNDTIDTLFKRVDSLMYKAKQKGKNTICF